MTGSTHPTRSRKRGGQVGVGALIGMLLGGLLVGCGPSAGSEQLWDGEISTDTYMCHDLKIPVHALEQPTRISDLDAELQTALGAAVRDINVPVKLDPFAEWIVVAQTDTRIDLLRALGPGESYGSGSGVQSRDHEQLSLTTEVGPGWSIRSYLTCALRVDLGELKPVDVWIDPDHLPQPGSTEVSLLVIDPSCGGKFDMPERVRVVRLDTTDEEVEIILGVVGLPPGGYTCEGFPPTPITLVLDQPLGDRTLIDASKVSKRALTPWGQFPG